MKCVITLAATNKSASARHELIPFDTLVLNWEEVPEDIKKYIQEMRDAKMRRLNELYSLDKK